MSGHAGLRPWWKNPHPDRLAHNNYKTWTRRNYLKIIESEESRYILAENPCFPGGGRQKLVQIITVFEELCLVLWAQQWHGTHVGNPHIFPAGERERLNLNTRNIEECRENTRRERAGARIPKLCPTSLTHVWIMLAWNRIPTAPNKEKKTSDLVAILQVAILNILNISRQIWVQWKLAWESDEEVVSFSVLFPWG